MRSTRSNRRLYWGEEQISEPRLDSDKKQQYRRTHSKPVVGAFFEWSQAQLQ
ncbi:IS66 family transposase [Marinobacterium rhizophilum]|uniref:Uncharacterized protein n=1 Tax=Marinobacterium rhizophilum TaxID=420402 RepID=A0ABY5HL64_9GAMM|nr:IS66 family transposase [Marinobacterium rhizophilum]UTW11987.1 hypothetical protein KDW95_22600 [Marinobacterium rhizophilum]